MTENTNYEEAENMEMPTPCQHCKKIVELSDMWESLLWHHDDMICHDCHEKEEQEIEAYDNE